MRNNNEEFRDYMPPVDNSASSSFPVPMGNSNNSGNGSTNPMYVMQNSGVYNHAAAAAMQSFAESQLHASNNMLNSTNMMRSYNAQLNGNQPSTMYNSSQNANANNLGRYGIQQNDSEYENYMKFALNHHKQTTKMDNTVCLC